MKRMCWTAGVLAAFFSIGLQAQVLDARADVPFDFWLGHTLMPAGQYSIYHSFAGTLAIKGEDGARATAVILANRSSRVTSQPEGKLQFMRYGDIYFLSNVWAPGQTDGFSIPKSDREKELTSRNVPSKSTGLALFRK